MICYTEPMKKKRLKNDILLILALLLAVAALALFRQKPTEPLQDAPGIVLTKDGVTIPRLDVSLSPDDAACMIAFFIYHGSCYVEYEWIEDADDLLGEYLGTAVGLIDEWTPAEGYVELAGSVEGDFFAVKGYDPAFMLCMKYETGAVVTYICNNGIRLKYGAELYQDRLHLAGQYSAVQYETSTSWHNSENELYQMSGNDAVITGFIEQLDKAECIPWDDAVAREGMTDASIYDTERYHMYFKMANGTTVHLRLYENGYVRFQGLLDVCVQIPKDSFDALIALMEDHTGGEPVAVIDRAAAKLEKCKNDPELGIYVPTYEMPESTLRSAEVFYYLAPKTGLETGTRVIRLDYVGVSDLELCYGITIARRDEFGCNGWAGPMLDSSELSLEALDAYAGVNRFSGVPEIDVGVWYGDVSVVLIASGADAEAAFKIFSSIGAG